MSEYSVREEFKKVLDLWKKISIPVSNSDSKKQIIDKLKDLMKRKEPLIISYGCGNAADKLHFIIAELRNKNVFSGKYLPWSKNNVFYGMLHYVCICYEIEGCIETPLSS